MARLYELCKADITATTVSRMEQAGEIVRLARGLYKLSDAPLDVQQSLGEAARLMPKGVICLASALAFHGLTAQMPPKVWITIGRKHWRLRTTYPPIRIARFSEEPLNRSVELHQIAGTSAPVFGVAEAVADLFRYRRTVGDVLAIRALRPQKKSPWACKIGTGTKKKCVSAPVLNPSRPSAYRPTRLPAFLPALLCFKLSSTVWPFTARSVCLFARSAGF